MFLVMYHYCHGENEHGQAGSRIMGYAPTKAAAQKKAKELAKPTATDKVDFILGSNPKEKKYRLWKNDEATGWVVAKLPTMYKLSGHEDEFFSGDEAEVKKYAEDLIIEESKNNTMSSGIKPKLKWKKKELYDGDYPTGLSVDKVW